MSSVLEWLPTTLAGWSALIAIAGGLGGALVYALKWADSVPDLTVAACDFEHRPADEWGIAAWPVINLSIKNQGLKTAVVTKVDCQVAHVWNLVRQFPVAQAMPPSARYDIVLDLDEEPPYTVVVATPHVLKSDEADRLQFTIATSPAKIFERLYHLALRIYYDENRYAEAAVLVVAPIVLKSPPEYFHGEFLAQFERHKARGWSNPDLKAIADELFDDSAAREVDDHNRKALAEAAALAGTTWSPRASELITRAKDAAG